MLKKKNKVNTALFKVVIKKGSSYFSQNISLKIIKMADTEHKFGSLFQKRAKNGGKRNLLKRRVLSILQKLSRKSAPALVASFLKGALDIPYQALLDEILFVKKANLIRL